jgi:hypothetical protein
LGGFEVSEGDRTVAHGAWRLRNLFICLIGSVFYMWGAQEFILLLVATITFPSFSQLSISPTIGLLLALALAWASRRAWRRRGNAARDADRACRAARTSGRRPRRDGSARRLAARAHHAAPPRRRVGDPEGGHGSPGRGQPVHQRGEEGRDRGAAACEPEVIDLGNYLNRMGAKITGLGTPFLHIEGVDSLNGCEHTIIPDRIEAATLMIAAVILHQMRVYFTGAYRKPRELNWMTLKF